MECEGTLGRSPVRARSVGVLALAVTLLVGSALYFVMFKLAAHPGLRHDNVPVKIEAVSTGRLVSSGEQSLVVVLPDGREVLLPFEGEVPERGEKVTLYSIDLLPDSMARPNFPYSVTDQATYSLTERTGSLNRGVWVLTLIPAAALLMATGLLVAASATLVWGAFSKKTRVLTFGDAYEYPTDKWTREGRSTRPTSYSQDRWAGEALNAEPFAMITAGLITVAITFLTIRLISPLKGSVDPIFYLISACFGGLIAVVMFAVFNGFVGRLALWAFARLSWGRASEVPASAVVGVDDFGDPAWSRWPLKWLKGSNWDKEVGLTLIGQFNGTLGELVTVSRSLGPDSPQGTS